MNSKRSKLLAVVSLGGLALFFDSEGEEENLIVAHQFNKMRSRKRKRICIQDYMEVIERYNLQDFRSHFRLSKTTFQVILNKIGPQLQSKPYTRGRPANDAKKQLLVALWMLVNQECYRTVADRFDVTISMVWDYFRKVITALVSIVKEIIIWPTTNYARQQIAKEFASRQGVTGVLGAIDGSHIPIVAPHDMPNSYVNRNKYHSLILQAVCTANYRFTDVYAGCPGSVHDARVLRRSPLGKKLLSYNYNIVPEQYHLLGDSAYPNLMNLITPYKDNGRLTRLQKQFNHKHSSTRVAIEQTFGLLKGRFRILRYVNIYNTKIIPKIIVSCCILHNMCIDMDDIDIFDLELHEDEGNDVEEGDGTNDGRRKRDALALQLSEM